MSIIIVWMMNLFFKVLINKAQGEVAIHQKMAQSVLVSALHKKCSAVCKLM